MNQDKIKIEISKSDLSVIREFNKMVFKNATYKPNNYNETETIFAVIGEINKQLKAKRFKNGFKEIPIRLHKTPITMRAKTPYQYIKPISEAEAKRLQIKKLTNDTT